MLYCYLNIHLIRCFSLEADWYIDVINIFRYIIGVWLILVQQVPNSRIAGMGFHSGCLDL